ncbi:Uncharacterised protein [Mycobacteroides abscessus subsp. bolletii]|uniref:hypothetical protein n=1 Tax=Mycobacteroides abscessus TaxID=36809 RepID=UPI0009D064D1|nr:hypothetical protein [Mycobacteroides abscessus]SLF32659.1 Uncharacterised protein [Mycobacteroides abscessus subsp. bolletii]
MSENTNPPNPFYGDDVTGLSVWVNGGYVEIAGPDYSRIDPDLVSDFLPAFNAGVTEAAKWARRWNPVTRSYQAGDFDWDTYREHMTAGAR